MRLRILLLTLCIGITTLYGDNHPALRETARGFSTIAKKAIPGVVFIKATMREPTHDTTQEEFMRRVFGIPVPPPQSRPAESWGSGFFIDQNGYIVTNHHVIRQAQKIQVVTSNHKTLKATLVGGDADTDLAVLKVETQGLTITPLSFGDSEKLEIGEWVMAVGAPLGLRSTLTVGVVSATSREGSEDNLANFIQTDASLNRGNSGGPLLNLDGAVIGVNTAAYAHGLGLAIPSNLAELVVQQLITKGHAIRSYLGIHIEPITAEMVDSYGLGASHGGMIAHIVKDSPADKAGLQFGDVITHVDQTAIHSPKQLQVTLTFKKPGTKLTLSINRHGKVIHKTVTLEAHPSLKLRSTTAGKMGLQLKETQEKGTESHVMIEEVIPNTPAHHAGIMPGSLLLAVNRQQVRTLEECQTAFEELKDAKQVTLFVKDGRGAHFVTLTLQD